MSTEDHAERGMVSKPMLEDFEVSAPDGTYTYLACPDGDCGALAATSCSGGWTIRELIDAAADHNRRFHS
jgi:hypothetical protein